MAEEKPNQHAELPTVPTDRGDDAVLQILGEQSRKGKLPGFMARPKARGLFLVEAYATPFTHEVIGRAESGGLRFELRAQRRWIWGYAIVLALSIWPGWPLTDDIIAAYSDWYANNIETWWWYLPLSVLSIPAVFKLWKKSRAEAHASALEQIDAISKALG
ncbi:MAG: hypothetical protein AAGB51_06610 [Planctomycetota bacterium]